MAYQQDFYRDEPERRPVTRERVQRPDTCHCADPFIGEDDDGDEFDWKCGLPMGDE